MKRFRDFNFILGIERGARANGAPLWISSADRRRRLHLAVDLDRSLRHRAEHATVLRDRAIAGLGAFDDDLLGVDLFAQAWNLIVAEIVGDDGDGLSVDA